MKTFKRIAPSLLFLVLTLAVATAIFAFSAQDAERSGETSEGVALRLLPSLAYADAALLGAVNHIIRKCAHAFVYALLGGFASAFWLTCIRPTLQARPFRRSIVFCSLLGWSFATLYAASDEIHQIFVPGRGPAPIDVLLDSSGAALGAAIAALIWVLTRKKAT